MRPLVISSRKIFSARRFFIAYARKLYAITGRLTGNRGSPPFRHGNGPNGGNRRASIPGQGIFSMIVGQKVGDGNLYDP
jgi:hypothetical protein